MAKRKRTKEATDREKWNKVFNQLVNVLQTQQTQLQFLSKERKLLEERIQSQYKRWVSDVNMFKDQISQMERVFTAKEMERMVEALKSDMFMGLKEREAFIYKHKLENTSSELADFREWFDYLSRKLSEHENMSKIADNKGEEDRVKALESEVRRLKYENEKLTSEKDTEVSALLAEKKFLWNQYNKMESSLKEQLQKKSADVELANKKIHTLLTNMEELQTSNSENNNEAVRLKMELTKVESDSTKKSEEISRLSKELELLRKSNSNSAKSKSNSAKSKSKSATPVLRKSKSESATPVLRRCTSGRGKNRSMDVKVVTVKKELDTSHTSQHSDKERRSSRRKPMEVITISDTPKLFTSNFKVPKLKSKV